MGVRFISDLQWIFRSCQLLTVLGQGGGQYRSFIIIIAGLSLYLYPPRRHHHHHSRVVLCVAGRNRLDCSCGGTWNSAASEEASVAGRDISIKIVMWIKMNSHYVRILSPSLLQHAPFSCAVCMWVLEEVVNFDVLYSSHVLEDDVDIN